MCVCVCVCVCVFITELIVKPFIEHLLFARYYDSHFKCVCIILQGCHNKIQKLSSFNKSNLFFHTSGGWESKIKVLAGLVSSEASLLGLQMAAYLLCPHVACPLCGSIRGAFVSL